MAAKSLVWNPPKDILCVVEDLGRCGLNIRNVLDYYGISYKAWEDECRANPAILRHYKRGKAKGVLSASQKLHENIEAGDTKAIIYFLDRQGKWKDGEDKPEDGEQTLTRVAMPENVTDPIEAAKVYAEIMLRK